MIQIKETSKSKLDFAGCDSDCTYSGFYKLLALEKLCNEIVML
jgi:hypothetical protein